MYELNPACFLRAYRCNDEGTFRSICPRCLQTIAQSAREVDVQIAEHSHVCNPAMVERYGRLSKAVSDYRVESRGHVHRVLGRCRDRDLEPMERDLERKGEQPVIISRRAPKEELITKSMA